jgi:hypothetical protein
MRRLLLLVVLALSMASCEFYDNGSDMTVVRQTAYADRWTLNNRNLPNAYFSYTFEVPEITDAVVHHGTVQVYCITNASPLVQVPLPYTLNCQANDYSTWLRTIDYEYEPGYLTVFFTNSNHLYSVENSPWDIPFRVVVMQ